MAESLGPPQSFSTSPERRSYPWRQWAARPFQQWMIYKGIDYDDEARSMDARLRTYAARHGMAVKVNASDPEHRGRIVFCFYEKTGGKPRLQNFGMFSMPSTISAEAADLVLEGTSVRCVICDAVQERPDHLMHVLECVCPNPNEKTDITSLYARHREEEGNSAGLRKINQFLVTWDAEDGPR